MNASQQQPTLVRLCLSDESLTRIRPLRRDHVWRCDFAIVRTADGSAVRILVIIDEFTRECLKMVVARSLGSKELLETLWGLFVARGIPEYVRPDNGPEFAAKAVRQWLARVGVKTLLAEPEGPREIGYDQAFIGKMRDELLNREVFETFHEARVAMGLGPYDELRPHGSLSYTPPAPAAGRLEASGAPTLRLAHSPAAGRPDSPPQDAPVRGESGHLETPREGAVTGIEERGSDLPVAALEIKEQEIDLLRAPVRGDGGHGAPRADLQEAAGQGPLEEIELLRRGAEKGLSGFQLELGERYARGFKGVPKDSAEARKWLTRAFHDPEFPEHKDQAAALLNELKSGMRAGPERAASRVPGTVAARLGSLKTWPVIVAIAAVAIAVLLWVNR